MKKCILLFNFYIFAYLMLNPAGFGKIYKRTQQEEVRGGEGEETTIGPPEKISISLGREYRKQTDIFSGQIT